MSYEIVKTIKINKDFTRFNVKSASNNVTPKDYEYSSKDIDIKYLLESFASGNFQYQETSDNKLLCIQELAKKYEKLFGGSWEAGSDLYHQYSRLVKYETTFAFKSIDEIKYSKEQFEERIGILNDYSKGILKEYNYTIKNYLEIKSKIENIIDEFLKELKAELKNKEEYVLKNGYNQYVLKKVATGAHLTNSKESAKRFKKYQAIEIEKLLTAFEKELV